MDSNSCELLNDILPAKPFLKWAGGKAQLIQELRSRFPKNYKRYLEPFIGGGALFFNEAPTNGYISDINDELVNCYRVIRNDVGELIKELKKYRYDEKLFYKTREADRLPSYKKWSDVRRAARLIFLNHTCFNGLYRVNSRGEFNVPFGDYKNPRILNEENLLACSEILSATEIVNGSFLDLEKKAKNGDFVYFDPPYAPLSATSSFTTYAKEGFGIEEQTQLRDLCVRLDKRGVFWMVSNSSAPIVLDLYSKFDISLVSASRAINSKATNRGKIHEVIVRNYNVGPPSNVDSRRLRK